MVGNTEWKRYWTRGGRGLKFEVGKGLLDWNSLIAMVLSKRWARVKVWSRKGAVGLVFTHRNRRLGGDWIVMYGSRNTWFSGNAVARLERILACRVSVSWPLVLPRLTHYHCSGKDIYASEGWPVPQIWYQIALSNVLTEMSMTHTLLHDHGSVREQFLLVASSNTEMRLIIRMFVSIFRCQLNVAWSRWTKWQSRIGWSGHQLKCSFKGN